MITSLDFIREASFPALVFKVLLSIFMGGAIGLERERKGRPAGLRTYILVCIGAALTVILSQYEHELLQTIWAEQKAAFDLKVDASRFGAQVINGIGFLGAGTIIVTGHQEVKGLTTAAGLWASGCLGLVIGAGFYEAALTGFSVIVLSHLVLPRIEGFLLDRASNMNVYVELRSIESIPILIRRLKSNNISVYEADLEKGHRKRGQKPSVIMTLGLERGMNHSNVIQDLSEMECVEFIEEI